MQTPSSESSRTTPATGTDLASFRVSTRSLPIKERLPFVREVFGRQVVRVDIEPLSDTPIDYEATLLKLPGLKILWSETETPARWTRNAEFVRDGNDDFVVFVQLDGTLLRSQRGIDLNLRCGDAASFLHEEPASIQFGLGKSLALMLPRSAILPIVQHMEDTPKQLIQNTEALSLLRSYASFIRGNEHLIKPATSSLISAHVYDLVAVAIGPTKDSKEIADGRGIRAARLESIKEFVLRSLALQGLSVTTVAQRFKITPRYIHMLFEAEELTFSSFVIENRLLRAHRMLQSAASARLSVSDVAFTSGFSDLSHFNRSFRRRFGARPTDVRNSFNK